MLNGANDVFIMFLSGKNSLLLFWSGFTLKKPNAKKKRIPEPVAHHDHFPLSMPNSREQLSSEVFQVSGREFLLRRL